MSLTILTSASPGRYRHLAIPPTHSRRDTFPGLHRRYPPARQSGHCLPPRRGSGRPRLSRLRYRTQGSHRLQRRARPEPQFSHWQGRIRQCFLSHCPPGWKAQGASWSYVIQGRQRGDLRRR